MKMRMFTFKLDPVTGAVDDGPLTAFFADRDALDATEHGFVHDGLPTLTMVVRYRDVPASSPRPAPERATEPLEIEPEHRALFEALRRWRNERAPRSHRWGRSNSGFERSSPTSTLCSPNRFVGPTPVSR